MTNCKHPRVQTFRFTDGTPAPLWGCVDCAHKFVPINLAMETEAARYRWLREKHAWWLLKHFPAQRPYTEAAAVMDEAIDAAMAKEPAS